MSDRKDIKDKLYIMEHTRHSSLERTLKADESVQQVPGLDHFNIAELDLTNKQDQTMSPQNRQKYSKNYTIPNDSSNKTYQYGNHESQTLKLPSITQETDHGRNTGMVNSRYATKKKQSLLLSTRSNIT